MMCERKQVTDLLSDSMQPSFISHSNDLLSCVTMRAVNAGACIDEHTADQILLYMALAAGTSQILVGPQTAISSLHMETVISVATALTGARFYVEMVEPAGVASAMEMQQGKGGKVSVVVRFDISFQFNRKI